MIYFSDSPPTCIPSPRPTQDSLPIFDLTNPSGDLNRHWTRRNHARGAYSIKNTDPAYAHLAAFSTAGDERNTDKVPFCDWLFTSRLDSDPGITFKYMYIYIPTWPTSPPRATSATLTKYLSATGYSHRVWTPNQVLYI